MEWVETTGRSISEAKEAALDQLGVDESDAEFEILEEPRTGLFGRVRGEARIRARIQPAKPRPKVERRDRRKREGGRSRKPGNGGNGNGNGNGGNAAGDAGAKTAAAAGAAAKPKARKAATKSAGKPPKPAATAAGTPGDPDPASISEATAAASDPASGDGVADDAPTARSSGRAKRTAPTSDRTPSAATTEARPEGTDMTDDDVTVQEQAELTSTFLGGLVEAFGLEGRLEQVVIDEDTIEVHIVGDDLGLLIGPKGQTLNAVQELSRTYVQRKATGTHHGRVRIDVGGYRQRRREALERFTRQVADQVLESGAQKALEPMAASDRKVVHDVANTIEGVRTLSEGEEPRRRVVIAPA